MKNTDIFDKSPPESADRSSSVHKNVAEFLLDQLSAWGVKTIYGVIGDANLAFLDAISKQNKIQYIGVRHETVAALMASAEAKLTGRIGVCLATSGPGTANLINGLADAYSDHAGVLAITGQVASNKIGTNTKQYIDQQQLLSPVASYTTLLTNPDALPDVMKKALTLSLVEGKVTHLSIPKDFYSMPVHGSVYPYEPFLHQPLSTPGNIVHQAAMLLQKAKKPMILVGRGIGKLEQQAIQLAEKWNAGIITTLPAKRLIPNDHFLYAGGLGQAGSEASSELLAACDMVLILGATWWPDNYVPEHVAIVQVDKMRSNIGTHRRVEMGVVGDLAYVLPLLQQELAAENRGQWQQRIKQVKEQWVSRISKEINSEGTPLAPQKVIRILSDTVADDAIIALDVGDHVLWFNRIFQAKQHEILISGRWRTLGFGLPAALAAQIAFSQKQVVALVGDGGFVQTVMDFLTAVKYHLPVVVVVMANGSYAMEKNRMDVAGLNDLGSQLNNPDFAQIAIACGGIGVRVEKAEQLQKALSEAFVSRKPTIIDVLVDDTVVPHTHV